MAKECNGGCKDIDLTCVDSEIKRFDGKVMTAIFKMKCKRCGKITIKHATYNIL